MVKRERISLYVTEEIMEAVKKLSENSKIGEKQNTIYLKCIYAGLKTIYGVDLQHKKE